MDASAESGESQVARDLSKEIIGEKTHTLIHIYIYIHSVLVEQKHKMCLTQMPFIYQESVTLDVNVYLPIQNTLPKWGNVEAL